MIDQSNTPEQPEWPTARDVADLLGDYRQMIADAGGWAHRIPAEQAAAWQARKDDLLTRIEATTTDRGVSAGEAADDRGDESGRGWSL